MRTRQFYICWAKDLLKSSQTITIFGSRSFNFRLIQQEGLSHQYRKRGRDTNAISFHYCTLDNSVSPGPKL